MLALSTTIVVPVFNGEQNLPRLVPRLAQLRRALGAPKELEVVFVNDGSADGSWRAIAALAAQEPWLRGVDLDGNFGQHAALVCGALEARTEAVITMDDDLTHPPEVIPALVAALAAGADLVYGTPTDRGPLGVRRAGSWSARCLLALRARARSGLRSAPLRAFRTEPRARFLTLGDGELNLDVLLYAHSPRVASVDVEYAWRTEAASRYSLRALARAAGAVALGPHRHGNERVFAVRERAGSSNMTCALSRASNGA